MSSAMPPSLALAALCGENATFASMPGRPRSFQSADDLAPHPAGSFLAPWQLLSKAPEHRSTAVSLVSENALFACTEKPLQDRSLRAPPSISPGEAFTAMVLLCC